MNPSETRVLQVVLSLQPGGTERLVLELVRRLHEELPMAVCCLDEAGAWGTDLRTEGFAVTALGRRPGFHPSIGRGVAAAARRHGATVIHAHHYSPFVYSAIGRVCGGPSRIVFTEHGRLSDAGPSAKRRAANRLLSHAASRVFTVSKELRAHVVDEGFPARRVGVIYNGISVGPRPTEGARLEIRTRLGVRDDTLVIGTIARLDPVKDLGTLIRAMAVLPVPATLIVIGDGSERGTLERDVRLAGLADRVQFLGHRDDARAWLAGCDIYANSSISEGISLTILEAMAAGLPVVATRAGGTVEIVDDACGRLVPTRNAHALGGALAELGADPGRRRALGTVARERVEQRFTIERMIGNYRDAYL
jgi:glycosyltransferase involved in cell wall biosynthesis